jgi:transposase
MRKNDARRLSPATLDEKRNLAIKLRKKGMTFRETSEIVGVHLVTVQGWHRKYKARGVKALKAKQRGRKLGEQRSLSKVQETEIQKLIRDTTPDQLKMPFALWTRQAIANLIQDRYGIKIPVRTMGHYLKRWGYTPQKPLKRAYEQRPKDVKRWLEEEYPRIAAQAKRESAEIHWGDETGLRSDDQRGRGYAPKGKTPVRRLAAKRSSINLISTVTNQGKLRFMLYSGMFTAQTLIKFLKRLIKDAKRKVFLILDNLRVHHAKLVREWMEEKEIQKWLRVFYLPSYSPELNPDEYLNCDLKGGVAARVPSRSREELAGATVSHLRMLQKNPIRVAKYFEHRSIRYAA